MAGEISRDEIVDRLAAALRRSSVTTDRDRQRAEAVARELDELGVFARRSRARAVAGDLLDRRLLQERSFRRARPVPEACETSGVLDLEGRHADNPRALADRCFVRVGRNLTHIVCRHVVARRMRRQLGSASHADPKDVSG